MRAFLAVELDEDLRGQVTRIQKELKETLATGANKYVRLTWARPETIHLTVRFLGDINESTAQPLRDAIAGVFRPPLRIDIPMERLGVFPRPAEPRVIWIGPSREWESSDDGARLQALVRAVNDACAPFSAERDDKPWRPHLTLARIRAGERDVGRAIGKTGLLARPLSLGSLHIMQLILMKSDLRPDGPHHTELWRLPE